MARSTFGARTVDSTVRAPKLMPIPGLARETQAILGTSFAHLFQPRHIRRTPEESSEDGARFVNLGLLSEQVLDKGVALFRE